MHNFTHLLVGMACFLSLNISHGMDDKNQPVSDIFVTADVAYKDHDTYLHGLKRSDDKASIFYSKIENL
jgi:hypothetical protein